MSRIKKPVFTLIILTVITAIALTTAACSSQGPSTPTPVVHKAPTPTAIATTTPTTLPTQQPSQVLGIGPAVLYDGIPWVGVSTPSCGTGLSGDALKNAIQTYHAHGVRVRLTICQGPNDARLTDTDAVNSFNDAAQSNPDAVQCGNEEMKQDPSVAFLYISPQNFAKFYDLCATAAHKVRADIPVLLGALDPHVGGIDYQPLVKQVQYLDQMQAAMNTSIHPGGNWDWHAQTLGLIDSWHNGYPNASVNSLYGIFSFWAQQFHVDLNSGDLGKHIWVVEGTGCFKGCGINENSPSQEAIAHILTLITDAQTAMRYGVPFFYFSSSDFYDQGILWPIGILDINGNPKPIRQDLPMGARTLNLSCPSGNVAVVNQEQLLAGLYGHCTLPSNYLSVIEG